KQYNPLLAPIFTFRPSQPTELPKRRGGRPYKRAGASTPGHTPSLTPNPPPAPAPTPIQDRETLDYGAFLALVARGDLKRAYEGAVQWGRNIISIQTPGNPIGNQSRRQIIAEEV